MFFFLLPHVIYGGGGRVCDKLGCDVVCYKFGVGRVCYKIWCVTNLGVLQLVVEGVRVTN